MGDSSRRGPVTQERSRRRTIGLQLGLCCSLLVGGCRGPEPAPEAQAQGPKADACLQGVTMKRLQKAIRACDAVVAAHPDNPQPRNERALLLSLAGRNKAACLDSQAASQLLARQPPQPAADPVLVEEIHLRQRTCKAWLDSLTPVVTTPPAGAAPSGETPASPPR